MAMQTTPLTRLRGWGLRLFRASLLIAVLLVIRLHGSGGWEGAQPITVKQSQALFPTAFEVRAGTDLNAVRDEEGTLLGYVVKTLPESHGIIGYAGPSDVLIALDQDGTVTGTDLLWSGDTEEHLRAIEKHPAFFDAFQGWTFSAENPIDTVDAVSGATLSSLAIVASVAVRLGGAPPSLKFPDAIPLDAVQRLFPDATALDNETDPVAAIGVRDASGQRIGELIRTSPEADGLAGYQGPSDGLVALTMDGLVAGITLGASYDNQRYADYVRKDDYFTTRYRGTSLAALAELDVDRVWADGVSGATMTSGAVMEGVIRRAGTYLNPPAPVTRTRPGFVFRWRDGATFLAIVLGSVVAFTRLRAHRLAQLALYLYLILILGLWVGDLASLAVLGGWAQGAVPLRSAPGLVALVAAAFALPWVTGKPVYCQHLCPHGAAQTLLYRMVPGRLRLPGKLHATLRLLPLLTVVLALALVLGIVPGSLSDLEPFDAWILGIGGIASIVIALVGLGASAFIPQAYCKYGCPTGLLLDYARTRRHESNLTRRDAIAVALLATAFALGFVGGR